MQWEAFFHRNNRNLSAICLASSSTVQFQETTFPTPDSPMLAASRPNPPSDGEFGEDVHAADLGRHPIVAPLLFDPDDGRLTADPALLARR